MRRTLEELIVGMTMLLMVLTNSEARNAPIGTAAYINNLGLLDFLNAALALCGGVLVYHALVRERASRELFAIVTIPLLLYIVASAIYTYQSGLSKTGAVVFAGYYLLLLYRVWDRPRKAASEH